MNCTDYQNNINEYIDNELDDKLSNALMKHINECENCKNEYNDLLELKSILSDLEELELPEGFSEELHEKLEAVVLEDKKILNISDYFKKYKVVISVAAVVLISVFAINTSDFSFNNDSNSESMKFAMLEDKSPNAEVSNLITPSLKASDNISENKEYAEEVFKEDYVTSEKTMILGNDKIDLRLGNFNDGLSLRASSYYIATENERTLEVKSSYLELENYILNNKDNFELVLDKNTIDSNHLIEFLINDSNINEFILDLKNNFTVLLDIPYSNNISINDMDDYNVELNFRLGNIRSKLKNELDNDSKEILKSELLFIKQEIENILSNKRIVKNNSGFTKVNLIINEEGE